MEKTNHFKILEEIRNLTKNRNVVIVTATQPPMPEEFRKSYVNRETPANEGPDVVFIDYIDLIKQ